MELLKISENKDLRVCGVAILTSSIIHRLKVESIFKLGKIANSKENNNNDKDKNIEEKIPIPEILNLQLPFRKESAYPVTLEELLSILEGTILELTNPTVRKNTLDFGSPSSKTIDFQDYLIKFEKIIEDYEIKLFEIVSIKKEIIFNDFVLDKNELDIARYFIAMLYLAMKQRIEVSYVDINDVDNRKSDKFMIENEKRNIDNNEKNLVLIKINLADNQIIPN